MTGRLFKGLLTLLLVLGLSLSGCSVLPLGWQGTQDTTHTSDLLSSDVERLSHLVDNKGSITAVIRLEGASLSGVPQEDVVRELKRHAALTQDEAIGSLAAMGATIVNTFWLTNAMLVEMPADRLHMLASVPRVDRLFENFTITLPELPDEEAQPQVLSVDYTWGLEKIGVPDVWDVFGVKGSGIRVAVLDTGVDISHPDLAGKMWTDDAGDPTYPGGWIEFNLDGNIVPNSTPHDTDGHGTHCSGTVLGGDASGVAIGVAPDATLMHALMMPYGWASYATFVAALQWAADPVDQYGEPAGTAAHVVSLSGGFYEYVDAFIEPIENMRAAGIVPVVAIGNGGEGTTGGPGNVYEAFGIGATDIDDYVASFSSGAEVYWPSSHPESYMKPDFSAPGVSVYSSVPSGYASWSGTSMAAPHVAGVAALMLDANPAFTVDDIYEFLKDTAGWYDHYYEEEPCTRYGWGRIDAFEAVSVAALQSGIEGFVTDADTSDPLDGAKVTIFETGQVRYTDDSGYYRFFLPEGSYNLTASTFGYYPGTAIVVVLEDVFTSQNFTLEQMPTGFIEGTVTDADTAEPIEDAIITLLDTPLSTTTNQDGEYSIEAPVGTYDIRAFALRYRPSVETDVSVPEDDTATVNFALEPVLAVVAVMGDYQSQLTGLLLANDIWAEERGWDVIDDMDDYDAVIVNSPNAPGQTTFLEFLEAASHNEVGVVFTSSYPGSSASYGISLLEWYLGDPVGQSFDYDAGDVYYDVREPHPIFDGLGDTITIITGGLQDYSWYRDYSGYTIGDIGAEYSGIRGDAVALNVYGESLHVLLAGLAAQPETNAPHWTDDARTIFVRSVLTASGTIEMDLTVVTTDLPPGPVDLEYEATLKAMGGSKPYTWDIIDGDLPDGLALNATTGVISGTPTEPGTFGFTVEVTDAVEATAIRDLSISVIVFTEFITDPEGDQFDGYGPDIVGVDYDRDENAVYFRVRTAEAIDPYDTSNYMFLDLDLDPLTGFVSPYPEIPTNDIGADAFAFIYPAHLYGTAHDMWSLPLPHNDSPRKAEAGLRHAYSGGLRGELYLWDPYYGFYMVGTFPVLTYSDHFWFAISLDMLDDDGIMAVVNLIGDLWDPTDVAPNESHSITVNSGVEGFVTETGTANPLEGVQLTISETGRVGHTDDSGYYRFHLVPDTYTVTATLFGYEPDSETVVVHEDEFTSQDFTLEQMPTGFIEGTVTGADTAEPIEEAIITLLDTPLITTTNQDGEYSIEAPTGDYDLTARARGYRSSSQHNVTVPEDDTVTVDFALEPALAVVAVLGDYNSHLTDLLLAGDIWAEERGWDVIDDMADYGVVVVNRPSDPGETTFLAFLNAASDHEVRVVFTSSYWIVYAWGISLLQWHLGDPDGQSNSFFSGEVCYRVTQAHPIFDGWDVGDEITIITGGDLDHSWFSGYSGTTIAQVGSQYGGLQGDAVALGAYGDSLHILLASLGPQWDTHEGHWTDDARTIFVRAVAMTFYDLAISSAAGGEVTTPGQGTFVYKAGTVVDLVAEADAGYGFLNWTGDVDDIADVNAASTNITMNDDYSITASFALLPIVTTSAATDVTTSSATLNMDFTLGDYSPIEVSFAFKKSADADWSHTDWIEKTAAGSHGESLTGLSSGTAYDFRATLSFDSEEITGDTLQFTTATPPPARAGCFIATAAYGTESAEEINILREFRDTVLLPNALGERFVSFYYTTSPPIANFISRNEFLRTVVRVGFVDRIVDIVSRTHNIWS